jgi:glycerol-3-phosphate cytidylyltransferase
MAAGKIGFTCSTFDLLHAGHVLMLEEAKSVCDYLIAGLQVDITDRKGKARPVQGLFERYIQLRGCKYVDEIIPYRTEEELYSVLTALPIDIRIVGEEKRGTAFTGSDLPIKIHFNRRKHGFSASKLRARLKDDHDENNMPGMPREVLPDNGQTVPESGTAAQE